MSEDVEIIAVGEKEEYKNFSIILQEWEGKQQYCIKIKRKRILTEDGWDRGKIIIPLPDALKC